MISYRSNYDVKIYENMLYRGEPVNWSKGAYSWLFTSLAPLQCVQGVTEGIPKENKRGVMTWIKCVSTEQNYDLKNFPACTK